MRKRLVAVVSMAVVAGAAFGAVGCSSSSTATSTPDGGSPHQDGAVADSHVKSDVQTGKADSTPQADAKGKQDSASSGDSGGGNDAGCPPPATVTYTAPTYVPAVPHQGVCNATQISDFIAACGFAAGADAACTAWQTANVTDGGTGCGDCIVAPKNNGGVWVDPVAVGLFAGAYPNYAGCIQLSDSTHGSACAAAYNDANVCMNTACETAACLSASNTGNPNAFSDCQAAASSGGCKAPVSAEQTACAADFADGGAATTTCAPSANSGNQDDDFTYILTLICGGTGTGSGSGSGSGSSAGSGSGSSAGSGSGSSAGSGSGSSAGSGSGSGSHSGSGSGSGSHAGSGSGS